MDTTNTGSGATRSYTGTTKITDSQGAMVQAGATQASIDAVNVECIYSGTNKTTSSLRLVNPSCNVSANARGRARQGTTERGVLCCAG